MAEVAQGTNNEVLTVNQTQLIGIQMTNWPQEQRGILLVYATGYDDGSGNFIPVKRKNLAVAPDDFAAWAAGVDLAGQTFFQALRAQCYAWIQADATA